MKTKKTIILAGFLAAALVGLIGVSLVKGYISSGKIKEASAGQIKEIKISAYRFGFEPAAVTVKKGQKIRLVINNTDALHGIRIPDLGVAGNDLVEFTANKTGEFPWFCNNFCGQGHQAMSGKLIVQ